MIYGSVCPAKNLCLFLLWNFPFLELQLGLGMCYWVYFPNKWTLPTLNSFRETGLAAAFASRITRTCIHKNRKYFDRNQCIPKVLPAFKSRSAEPSERLLLWINRWFPRHSYFPLSSRNYCRFPCAPWDHEDDFNEDAHARDCGESWLLWAELSGSVVVLRLWVCAPRDSSCARAAGVRCDGNGGTRLGWGVKM